MRGLEASVGEVLDRRLLSDRDRPVAIGLSGGGDSVALTLIADAWAKTARRPLLILTIDHGLQTQSRDWTQTCARFAAGLGHAFHALSWTGDKPTTGLPAAARAARHRLLAEAAREAGASVLLMGHTADDRLESQAMRAAGSTTPDPREWAPSPAWPEGRGLFLLRPMLEVRRAALRAWLAARGQAWIDDPANLDLNSARPRARQAVSGFTPSARFEAPPLALAARATHRAGIITIARRVFREATIDDARRFVALASVCAGGGARRPASTRIHRAAEALRALETVTLTLAGARLEADAGEVRVFREAGEIARRGLAALTLAPGQATVWDGRFELSIAQRDVRVRRLAGLKGRLPSVQRSRLRDLPPAARGSLPVLVSGDGSVTCPITGDARSLIPDRFAAAAGLVDREPG